MRFLLKLLVLPTVVGLTHLSAFAADHSSPVAVYDSMASPQAGWGLGGVSILGQSVSLADNARRITQIDVQLWGVPSNQFWIRIYDLGDLDATPAGVYWDRPPEVIWESPLQSFGALPAPKIISILVPGILVPDAVAWAVAPFDQSSTNLYIPAVIPTSQVGTTKGVVVRTLDGRWATAISDWKFGARLIAVPEQSTGSLAAAALGVAIHLSRRRQSTFGAAFRV